MSITSKRLLLVVVLCLTIGSMYLLPISDWITAVADWSSRNPKAGAAIYIAFVAVATVLFLPGSVAMMLGGFVFGLLPGIIYAAIAIPVGAQCAFFVGRWIARPWVRSRFQDNPRLQLLESALQHRSFLIVALTRLSLIIPFNVLNYAYGATAVRGVVHFAATTVGMLPAVALYVYIGTLARNVSQIMAGEVAPPELGYWLLAVGLVVVALVTWVIHRTAAAVLTRELQNKNGVETEL